MMGAVSLRVGLDVTPALSGLTGVARHTLGIDNGLRERGVDVRSFAIGRGRGQVPTGTRRLRVPLRVVTAARRRGVPLRAEWLTGDVDLVHSIDLDPVPSRAPLVVTIHDMVAIEYPELHPPHAVDAARRRLRATEHASAILPNSNATAEVLVRLGVDRSRLTVVHHAPHPLPEVPAEEAGIAGPYLLAVGELTLRKDYPTMFQAFAAADLPAHRLVVVGPRGFGAETVEAAAVASGLDDRLVIVGYASERRLSALYAGAVALCQTSRQEGFGLPVVEGMRHALPIIACDIDIVHEVAGEAAVTAPVGDVRGFAAAMEAVVRDEALRTRLAAASWARRDRFTWEGTIDGTMAAYRKVLA